MSFACFGGYTNIVKYLYSHGCKYDITATECAAYRNNLYLLMWLYKKKFPIDKAKCMGYIVDGALNYIIDIRNGKNDCKTNIFTCTDSSCNCKYKEYRAFFKWSDEHL